MSSSIHLAQCVKNNSASMSTSCYFLRGCCSILRKEKLSNVFTFHSLNDASSCFECFDFAGKTCVLQPKFELKQPLIQKEMKEEEIFT